MSINHTQFIEHQGVVERIVGRMASIRIVQASACSSCSAAHLCSSSETKEKTVEALCPHALLPQVGQRVRVQGRVSQGMLAAGLAYALPLALLMGVLFAVSALTGSEGIGALAALASLLPYYAVLHLLRHRLQQRLLFVVQEIIL